MFTKSYKNIESCPAQLRKLKIGESTYFDNSLLYAVEKAAQRLKTTESLYFTISTKEDGIRVTRKEAVKNSGTEAIINTMKVGEFYTRPAKAYDESSSIISDIKDKKFNIMHDINCKQIIIARIA